MKLKVKDLQRHYYTDNPKFYTTKEIMTKPIVIGNWIPYGEYIRVLTQLAKSKNKLNTLSNENKNEGDKGE